VGEVKVKVGDFQKVKPFLKSSGFKKSQCVLCVGATAERVTSDGPTKPVPLIFYAFFLV
jgi:hypothetical protein